MNLQALDNWHKTKLGNLTFGLVELLASYLFVSLAIDSGSLLEYTAALILFVGAIQNFVKLFRTPKNDSKRR
jgi:hypothetical protein